MVFRLQELTVSNATRPAPLQFRCSLLTSSQSHRLPFLLHSLSTTTVCSGVAPSLFGCAFKLLHILIVCIIIDCVVNEQGPPQHEADL